MGHPIGPATLWLVYAAAATFVTAAPLPPKPSILTGRSLKPLFEEDPRDVPDRLFWRKRETVVSFGEGGAVTIHTGQGTTPRILFAGADPGVQPVPECPAEQRTLYYVGAPEDWHANANFGRIRYKNIYPGVDLVFHSSQGDLEFDFEIAPYADPSLIRLRYEGLSPRLLRTGGLETRVPGFHMLQRPPQAFELRGGASRTIPCHYRLTSDGAVIDLEAFDPSAQVVIDPVLVFSTYLGGAGFDAVHGATTDASGNLYLTGQTTSTSMTNPALPVRSNSSAFVAKLDSMGTRVLYLVYLGGSGSDSGNGIAVDSSGNAFITGTTTSPNFPVTATAFLKTAPGPQNVFVAKVNSAGQLQYGTYLGGASLNSGSSIAVDSTGAAYVTGQTQSVAFPVTSGVLQTSYGGGLSDCFVAKLNAAGSALSYSTLLGGSGLDYCSGIAVDASGDAYVSGTTYSANFPVKSALQATLRGTASVFVAKLNPTGASLFYSTYLGGSGADLGNAIAVDSSGEAYVAGAASSSDLPVTAGVFQNVLNGVYNAFVFKLSPAGSLVYCTYLGGSSSDTAAAIAIDPTGRAVVGGYTNSANFPVVGAVQQKPGGSYDAFVSILDPAAATLIFSSYFGGGGDDRAYAVASSPSGALYVAGMTSSNNLRTLAALQSAISVPYDGFVLDLQTSPTDKIGIFRTGTWILNTTGTGVFTSSDAIYTFGMTGDVPVVGDWTGNGTTKIGVYRNGTWILDTNGSGQLDASDAVLSYGGLPGDVPVVGDWTGNGVSKIGIYRNGTWILDTNGNGQFDLTDGVFTYGGLPGDVPVVGDWNGSGTSKIGIYRHGTWILDSNGNNQYDVSDLVTGYGGLSTDIPVVGKWAASAKSLIGIYRTGTWILDSNGNNVFDGGDVIYHYGGLASDLPVVGHW